MYYTEFDARMNMKIQSGDMPCPYEYREDHKDVDSLFKERDAVLDVIDTFTYSKVGK